MRYAFNLAIYTFIPLNEAQSCKGNPTVGLTMPINKLLYKALNVIMHIQTLVF
nr:MAG TPA: hypothetical protein [Caudoviricetes sp.]